jgi:hypothetical protein
MLLAFVVGGFIGFSFASSLIRLLILPFEQPAPLGITDVIDLQMRVGFVLAICAVSPFLSAYLISKVWLDFWKILLIASGALLALLIGFTVFIRNGGFYWGSPTIYDGLGMSGNQYIATDALPIKTAWLSPPIILIIISILTFLIKNKSTHALKKSITADSTSVQRHATGNYLPHIEQ